MAALVWPRCHRTSLMMCEAQRLVLQGVQSQDSDLRGNQDAVLEICRRQVLTDLGEAAPKCCSCLARDMAATPRQSASLPSKRADNF